MLHNERENGNKRKETSWKGYSSPLLPSNLQWPDVWIWTNHSNAQPLPGKDRVGQPVKSIISQYRFNINVSFFWYRTQMCLCSSLKHEGLLNHLYFPQCFGTCGWCGCLSCCSSQKHIWLLFVIICCQKLFLLCMKQSDYITLSRRKTQHFFRWATVQNKTFTTTSFCSDPIPMTTTYFIIQLALWLCKTKKILSSDWLLEPAFATLGLHTLLAQKQEIQQNHTHPFQDLITVVFIGKKEWYLPTCIAVHRVDLKEEQIHMNKMNYYA